VEQLTLHNEKEILEHISLVENLMRDKFPNAPFTTSVTRWDDGTHQVECRYGDDEKIYSFLWYNNEVTYGEEILNSNFIKEDAKGNQYYIQFVEGDYQPLWDVTKQFQKENPGDRDFMSFAEFLEENYINLIKKYD
jgi:hypothetical protein